MMLLKDSLAKFLNRLETQHTNGSFGFASCRGGDTHASHAKEPMQYTAFDIDVLDARVLDHADVAKQEAVLNDQPTRPEAIAVHPLLPQCSDQKGRKEDHAPQLTIVARTQEEECQNRDDELAHIGAEREQPGQWMQSQLRFEV